MIALLAAAACTIAYGCAASADSTGVHVNGAQSVQRAQSEPARVEPVSTVVDARPAAIVDGRGVTWGDLRPLLNEAAGAAMLRELILDRRIQEEAAERGIVIGRDHIDAERRLLIESLDDDPDTALRLLDTLRERQGLGRVRFERLLARNAALRAMVRDRVQVSENDVIQLHEVTHGAKRQPRLIVVRELNEARAVLERIEAGELFADVATEVSIDASAPRGGLLEPISLADPSYPEAMRLALWGLEPGQVSQPIMLDGQYALLQLVRKIPAQEVELESVRSDLARQARLNRERMMMDQLARRLTADVAVTIFDDALNEAWRRARR